MADEYANWEIIPPKYTNEDNVVIRNGQKYTIGSYDESGNPTSWIPYIPRDYMTGYWDPIYNRVEYIPPDKYISSYSSGGEPILESLPTEEPVPEDDSWYEPTIWSDINPDFSLDINDESPMAEARLEPTEENWFDYENYNETSGTAYDHSWNTPEEWGAAIFDEELGGWVEDPDWVAPPPTYEDNLYDWIGDIGDFYYDGSDFVSIYDDEHIRIPSNDAEFTDKQDLINYLEFGTGGGGSWKPNWSDGTSSYWNPNVTHPMDLDPYMWDWEYDDEYDFGDLEGIFGDIDFGGLTDSITELGDIFGDVGFDFGDYDFGQIFDDSIGDMFGDIDFDFDLGDWNFGDIFSDTVSESVGDIFGGVGDVFGDIDFSQILTDSIGSVVGSGLSDWLFGDDGDGDINFGDINFGDVFGDTDFGQIFSDTIDESFGDYDFGSIFDGTIDGAFGDYDFGSVFEDTLGDVFGDINFDLGELGDIDFGAFGDSIDNLAEIFGDIDFGGFGGGNDIDLGADVGDLFDIDFGDFDFSDFDYSDFFGNSGGGLTDSSSIDTTLLIGLLGGLGGLFLGDILDDDEDRYTYDPNDTTKADPVDPYLLRPLIPELQLRGQTLGQTQNTAGQTDPGLLNPLIPRLNTTLPITQY